jgi:hypothetical protein
VERSGLVIRNVTDHRKEFSHQRSPRQIGRRTLQGFRTFSRILHWSDLLLNQRLIISENAVSRGPNAKLPGKIHIAGEKVENFQGLGA